MKISLNWIKTYLPGIKIDPMDVLVEKMWGRGFDIESVEYQGDKFKGFVVGKVTSSEKHSNADKLSVCTVDIGAGEDLHIVCGAPNVEAGQKVCVAKVGAVIPAGGFEIKKTKIRGEVSEGMICSEKELEISDDHEGILVLDENAEIGTDFASYMGADDTVLDIWVPPNRGDMSSHIGVAREFGALYDMKAEIPEVKLEESDTPTEDFVKITIDNTKYCKRFTGRVIEGIEIKESPDWLKKRLIAVGLRPRNNVVDITNFVMMETGQPLHSFDYDKIRGREIIIKTAREGDKFTTLDSKERKLSDTTLMVCDKEGYSGIAGIMGGELSEITDGTKNVFLEVAYFDPVNVRRSAKKMNIITDASQRFEKGVDIEGIEYASNRAAALIKELAGGKVSKGFYDVYPEKFSKIEVGIRKERTEKLLGMEMSEDEIKSLLDKIEIRFLRREDEYLIFDIPEYRRYDIEREVDLIEEVARLKGYDKLTPEVTYKINFGDIQDYGTERIESKNKIREHFIGRGFNEIISDSQQEDSKVAKFSENYVPLENSASVEMNTMRVNLMYGMLDVIKNNVNHSGKDIPLKLFEIGRSFEVGEGGKFSEKDTLCFALSGNFDLVSFNTPERSFDIFDLKGELEILMSKLNLENFRLFYYNEGNINKNIQIDISVNDKKIGQLYKIGKELLDIFDIEVNVYLCEINLDVLLSLINKDVYYNEISKFPVVKRDLAFITERDISYDNIKDTIVKSGGKYLSTVRLFDVYSGKGIEEGKKSMAFSLNFSSTEKTLTDEEVNGFVRKIADSLKSRLNVTLRDGQLS